MLQGEQKKTRPAREDRPHDTVLEEDLLIQVNKTLEPLPHSYIVVRLLWERPDSYYALDMG